MNVALVQHAGGSNPAPIVAWQCWQVVTVTVTVLLVAARATVMVMVGSIRLAASASVSRK